MVFLLVSLGLGTFSQVESPIPSLPFGNPSGRAANAAIVSQMSQRTGHLVPLVKPLVQPLVSRGLQLDSKVEIVSMCWQPHRSDWAAPRCRAMKQKLVTLDSKRDLG